MPPSISLPWHILLFLLTLTLGLCSAAQQHNQQEVNLGTTLVAICYNDGVVVGADTRTSVGSYVSNRYADKIATILQTAVICRSGSAADTQHLAEMANIEFRERYYRFRVLPSVSQIAHLLRSQISQDMAASLICAGYEAGEGCIYSISPNGSLLKEDQGFAVSGSGSTFILGHMDNNYRRDMNEQEAIDFVVNAIRLAIDRDGSSGGFVRIHVVNRDGSKVSTVYPDHNKSLKAISKKSHQLTGFAASKRKPK